MDRFTVLDSGVDRGPLLMKLNIVLLWWSFFLLAMMVCLLLELSYYLFALTWAVPALAIGLAVWWCRR